MPGNGHDGADACPGRRLLLWYTAAMFRFAALAASVLITLSTNCYAADIMGQATVIDGDTMEIHGKLIRLSGIDALEG